MKQGFLFEEMEDDEANAILGRLVSLEEELAQDSEDINDDDGEDAALEQEPYKQIWNEYIEKYLLNDVSGEHLTEINVLERRRELRKYLVREGRKMRDECRWHGQEIL